MTEADLRKTGVVAPLVSVIIPSFGRRPYVEQAIDSALGQRGIDPQLVEVLVSTDETKRFREKEAKYARVRAISAHPGCTLGEAVCAAIESSRGEVISFLDDDDLFLENKLAIVIEEFKRKRALGFLSCGFSVIDTQGRPLEHSKFRHRTRRGRQISGRLDLQSAEVLETLRRVPPTAPEFNSSTMTLRRSVFTADTLSVLRRISRGVDTFYFYAALAAGVDFAVDPRILSLYRLHAAGLTSLSLEHPDSANVREPSQLRHASLPGDLSIIGELHFQDVQVGRAARRCLGALAAYMEFYLMMGSARSSRKSWFELALRLNNYRDTWVARNEPNYLLPSVLFSLSPWIGARVYAWMRASSRESD
jgi:glycosyltransferase involved in cell wall biosynthesis